MAAVRAGFYFTERKEAIEDKRIDLQCFFEYVLTFAYANLLGLFIGL